MLCLALDCLVISVLFLVLVREPPRGHTMLIPYYLGLPSFYPDFSAEFRGDFLGSLGHPPASQIVTHICSVPSTTRERSTTPRMQE